MQNLGSANTRFRTLHRLIRTAAWSVLSLSIYSASVAEDVDKARVLPDNSIEINGEKRILHGAVIPLGTQKCLAGVQSWPCGAKATLRLHSLLQSRPLTCAAMNTGIATDSVRCTSAEIDIAEQLVAEGWGLVPNADATYEPAERAARIKGSGIWADGFAPPGQWRDYPDPTFNFVKDLQCSECAVRKSR